MFDWFNSFSGVALPLAVWIAIVTFVVREMIDGHKKRQERKRKEKAISLLIGQELELNYWALDSLMYALKYLDQDSYSYELKTNFDGVKFVKWDSGDGYTTASLPVFVTKQYERLLPDIAQLDESLFELLNATYEEITDLEHYRKTAVNYFSKEDNIWDVDNSEFKTQNDLNEITFRKMTKDFLFSLVAEQPDYFKTLNETHVKLLGCELKKRVR